MNKFDLGILLIILICMLVGYYRGLVKSILSLVQYFAVIVLSIYFAPLLSKILIESFNLDLIFIEWVKNNQSLFSNTLSIINDEIMRNVVGRIINVLSMIILVIVFKLIFTLVIILLNKIANLPILCVANKFGGLILGAFNGILAIYLLILFMNWIPLEYFSTFREGISSSVLGTTISCLVPEVANEVISTVKTSV